MNLVETLTTEKEAILAEKKATEELQAKLSRKLQDTVDEVRDAFQAVGLPLVDAPFMNEEKEFTISVAYNGDYLEKIRIGFAPECWHLDISVYGLKDESIDLFKESVADKVKHVMSYTF